jgi:hypothetical protein
VKGDSRGAEKVEQECGIYGMGKRRREGLGVDSGCIGIYFNGEVKKWRDEGLLRVERFQNQMER